MLDFPASQHKAETTDRVAQNTALNYLEITAAIAGTIALTRSATLAKATAQLTERLLPRSTKVLASTEIAGLKVQAAALKNGIAEQNLAQPASTISRSTAGLHSQLPISPDAGNQSRTILEQVLPKPVRYQVASRSPLFDYDLARSFRTDIEKAFPKLEERLSASIGQRSFPRIVNDAEQAIQPVYSRVAQELNFPAPKFEISHNLDSRGLYVRGYNRTIVGTKTLADPRAFFGTGYHELTHAEQANLFVRHLADRMKLPAHPSSEQFDSFVKEWTNFAGRGEEFANSGSESWQFRRQTVEYLRQAISLRNGQPLSGDAATRAEQLFQSLTGKDYGPHYNTMQNYLASHPLPNVVTNHLLYRSKLHELEAMETGHLVQRLGSSVSLGRLQTARSLPLTG